MPLYEYKCKSCNKVFEALQRMGEEPLQKCLYCNGRVEKLVSASSFQLKGSGWYVTDYKAKNSNSSTGASSVKNSDANNNSNKSGKDQNATIK